MLVYTAEPDSPSHGFRLLDELAGLIGGVVGCSRVVTNAGWGPHADQISQTGARIAPEIYIACGISGATQHMVGARGAKRILVINTDRDAPIMTHADYAVIGDPIADPLTDPRPHARRHRTTRRSFRHALFITRIVSTRSR